MRVLASRVHGWWRGGSRLRQGDRGSRGSSRRWRGGNRHARRAGLRDRAKTWLSDRGRRTQGRTWLRTRWSWEVLGGVAGGLQWERPGWGRRAVSLVEVDGRTRLPGLIGDCGTMIGPKAGKWRCTRRGLNKSWAAVVEAAGRGTLLLQIARDRIRRAMPVVVSVPISPAAAIKDQGRGGAVDEKRGATIVIAVAGIDAAIRIVSRRRIGGGLVGGRLIGGAADKRAADTQRADKRVGDSQVARIRLGRLGKPQLGRIAGDPTMARRNRTVSAAGLPA